MTVTNTNTNAIIIIIRVSQPRRIATKNAATHETTRLVGLVQTTIGTSMVQRLFVEFVNNYQDQILLLRGVEVEAEEEQRRQ
jgi:hypothetical protein